MKDPYLYFLKRLVFAIHKLLLKLGIQMIPAGYYSPVPNLMELKKSRNLWAKKSELPGVFIDLEDQIKNLKNITSKYCNEWKDNKIYEEGVRGGFGPGFGYIEAQALHSVVRYYKPRRIVEVGSGVSTYCSFSALQMNKDEGRKVKITAIEPYPYQALKRLIEENNNMELVNNKVQEVPLEFFETLDGNDLLFIDSSHTVKIGSDVNYLILEVLPRLKSGVLVHFHDISLPYDYQKNTLQTYYHRSETSLLRAFLIHNRTVEILFCMSMLHHCCQEELKQIFPDYNPENLVNGLNDSFKPSKDEHFPSSIYIKIKKT